MKFHYISDIHLEKVFCKGPILKPARNVPLFLAGDIGNPNNSKYEKFLGDAAENYDHVFLVAGNHEYGRLSHETDFMQRDCRISDLCRKIGNISYMNRRTERYKDFIIAGATLWTHTPFANQDRILTENERHFVDSRFIDRVLNLAEDEKVIIVTHHLPSYLLISKYYRMHPRWSKKTFRWASHSDYLLRKPVNYWICGHSHIKFHGMVQEVQVLINASGNKIMMSE